MTRAAYYARISSVMQSDNYSIPAQQRALEEAIAARGLQLVLPVVEEGLSARSESIEKRPGFKRLLEAAERREVDVILVHSLDRWSRNLSVTLHSFGVLARAGVAFISLTENIDYTTPEGKLFLAMLGAFAQYYSDALSKHVAKGKGERVRQGLHNNVAPFGYAWQDGVMGFDPRTEAAAREMWRLAAQGWTDHQVRERLANLGFPMSRDTVRYLLKNRVFLGEVRHRGEWYKGKQPAMVDQATWDAVRALRVSHRRTGCTPRTQPRGPVHTYVFGGVLTCARCGRHFQSSDQGTQYICWGRRAHECDQPMVTSRALGLQFGQLLERISVPQDELLDALARRPKAATARPEAIKARLARLRDLYEMGDVDRAEYVRRRAELQEEMERAARMASMENLPGAHEKLRDLGSLWLRATEDERKRIVADICSDVLVDEQRIVAIRPQEALAPLLAALLPGDGKAGYLAVG